VGPGEEATGLLEAVPLTCPVSAVGLDAFGVSFAPRMSAEALLGAGAKLPSLTDWLESEAAGAVAVVVMSGTVTVSGDSSIPEGSSLAAGDSSGDASGLGAATSFVGTFTVLRSDGGAVPLTTPCRHWQSLTLRLDNVLARLQAR